MFSKINQNQVSSLFAFIDGFQDEGHEIGEIVINRLFNGSIMVTISPPYTYCEISQTGNIKTKNVLAQELVQRMKDLGDGTLENFKATIESNDGGKSSCAGDCPDCKAKQKEGWASSEYKGFVHFNQSYGKSGESK